MIFERPIDPPVSLSKVVPVYDRQRLQAADRMLPYMLTRIPSWPKVGGGKRVIVLGGGIAGLCSAWSLRQAGFEPIVLERTHRAGGRFYTLRDHFGDQYAELGVTRIADTHELTLAYARHFGLSLREYERQGTKLFHVLGSRFLSTSRSGADYPQDFPLRPEERMRDGEGLSDFYTSEIFAGIGDPRSADWPPPDVRAAFNGKTFLRALDGTAASPAAREICRAYNGTEIEMFDALAWCANQKLDAHWERTYAIEGGNDRLTTAFAEALGDAVVTCAKVRRVVSRQDGVSVSYTCMGREETVEGDFVVCTVPHRILSEIRFDPPLSPAKRDAAERLEMIPITRINFQFDRRFWHDEGIKGLLVACTTTRIERLWDLTALQAGTPGILAAYVQDRNAEALDHLPSEAARIEEGLKTLEGLFPGARQYFLKGMAFSWHHQPHTLGAWPAFGPNQTDLIAHLQRGEGRVRFAGDYTCLYTGWAQGALESAHFATAEVIAASLADARAMVEAHAGWTQEAVETARGEKAAVEAAIEAATESVPAELPFASPAMQEARPWARASRRRSARLRRAGALAAMLFVPFCTFAFVWTQVRQPLPPPPQPVQVAPAPVVEAAPPSSPAVVPEPPKPRNVPRIIARAQPRKLPDRPASEDPDYRKLQAPGYPAMAFRRGEEGTVVLRVRVNANGEPLDVRVDRSSRSRLLDRAAQQAVRRWKFKPAIRNGKPVDSWVLVPVDFRLDEGRILG